MSRPPRPYFPCRPGRDEADLPETPAFTPPMTIGLTLEVLIQGVLTGLVYGLMALGLSVIFGVVRVVNFAHGEFAVLAMYAAYVLFSALKLDPFIALAPIAALFFVVGYG